MPELNVGTLQGDILPLYLAVRRNTGEPVPQPEGNPSVEVTYLEPDTHIRRVSIARTPMTELSDGVWYFLWRIPKDETPTEHVVIFQAIIEEEQVVATDQSFTVTKQLQNPEFVLKVNILENTGICYPEVTEEGPKCRERRILPTQHLKEVDIGLDDFFIEGANRLREYPNRVVDRRVVGRTQASFGVLTGGGAAFIGSDEPGGGSAQRPGGVNIGTRYATRSKYRYGTS